MSAAPAPATLVMAKSPIAGIANTRLEPLLGREGSALLQAALIRQAVRWAAAVAPGASFLAYTPDPIEALGDGVVTFAQQGGHLGERLEAATRRVFERHDGPLLVIGTDVPTLVPAHADAALAELRAGHDLCFGPAADGGYYLVALARPCAGLFALPACEWGGPRVLELSLTAARAAGLRVTLLDVERDIDTPQDARAVVREASLPAEVAGVLRACGVR